MHIISRMMNDETGRAVKICQDGSNYVVLAESNDDEALYVGTDEALAFRVSDEYLLGD